MENVLAIMGIDPGGKTGVAQALFHTDEPTVEQAFKSAMYKQSHTVEGRIREQIIELNNRWRRFYREMVGIGVAPNKVLMCVEDYISTPGIKADDPLSPVKIGWGLYGMRIGGLHEFERNAWGPAGPVFVHWQLAGNVMGFAKNDRLKLWGVYRSGKAHECDAWRHVAFRLAEHFRHAQSRPAPATRTRVRHRRNLHRS